ncbi:hypothetical protein EYF80_042565 [Liparis tanakae]|uniref:Uncharacterized protein n=1 Tax=Liparis tanakae TaxID=230148 RepID=A0A4Z2G138_9TELE|nr:hypothetical protein EYF80_042565 [Liparis tanakae]
MPLPLPQSPPGPLTSPLESLGEIARRLPALLREARSERSRCLIVSHYADGTPDQSIGPRDRYPVVPMPLLLPGERPPLTGARNSPRRRGFGCIVTPRGNHPVRLEPSGRKRGAEEHGRLQRKRPTGEGLIGPEQLRVHAEPYRGTLSPYLVPKAEPYRGTLSPYLIPQAEPYRGTVSPYLVPKAEPYRGTSSPYLIPQAEPYRGTSSPYIIPQAEPYRGTVSPYLVPKAEPYRGTSSPYLIPQAEPYLSEAPSQCPSHRAECLELVKSAVSRSPCANSESESSGVEGRSEMTEVKNSQRETASE